MRDHHGPSDGGRCRVPGGLHTPDAQAGVSPGPCSTTCVVRARPRGPRTGWHPVSMTPYLRNW